VNALSGVFYLLLSMLGYGLTSGIQVQMSRRIGEGDHTGLVSLLKHSIVLVLCFSFALMLIASFLVPYLYDVVLHDATNRYLNQAFFKIRIWGLPFLMLTHLFNTFFISINNTTSLIWGSLLSTLTNILLDYILIFGHAGMPALGIEGAAYASVFAELVYVIIMIGQYVFSSATRSYELKNTAPIRLATMLQSLKVAAPLIVQFLFSIGGWQIFFIFVEHLGKLELASSQILRSIFGVVGVATWAFASTTNTLVSKAIGADESHLVLQIIKRIAIISLGFTLLISSMLLLYANSFLTLYTQDLAIIKMALPSLQVIVLAMGIMSLATVVFNGVVGTGNTIINLVMEISCVGVYLIYCFIVIEQQKASLQWAWMSEFVYWSSLLVLSIWYLHSGKWKGKMV
jgi:putative MATE family efflux protein